MTLDALLLHATIRHNLPATADELSLLTGQPRRSVMLALATLSTAGCVRVTSLSVTSRFVWDAVPGASWPGQCP